MRFEVRYPTGTVHEVELQGTLAVIGRDPSCDLVLNDAKCSRRHAVVEAGPQGLSIRDSGSANGVFVNGKRVERATLQEGDEVRLGEATLKVLGEEVPGTLVMGPDEIVDMVAPPAKTSDSTPTLPPDPRGAEPAPPAAPPAPPALPRVDTPPTPALPVASPIPAPPAARPATPPTPPTLPKPPVPPPPRPAVPTPPPPPASGPAPRPPLRAPSPEPLPRPLTVTVLGGVWLLNSALSVLGGVLGTFLAIRAGGSWVGSLLFSLLYAALGLALGLGILGKAPWARLLQIGVSGFGLLTCIFTPLSAVTLFYMMRPVTQILFSGRSSYRALTEEEADLVRRGDNDAMFAGGIAASLLLAFVLTGLAFVAVPLIMLKLAG